MDFHFFSDWQVKKIIVSCCPNIDHVDKNALMNMTEIQRENAKYKWVKPWEDEKKMRLKEKKNVRLFHFNFLQKSPSFQKVSSGYGHHAVVCSWNNNTDPDSLKGYTGKSNDKSFMVYLNLVLWFSL